MNAPPSPASPLFELNAHGQPVGPALPGWTARPRPGDAVLEGAYCRIEPLALHHGPALYEACRLAPDGRDWTYMSVGPFASEGEYLAHLGTAAGGGDPKHYAVIDLELSRPSGTLALLRIDSASGVIEVGHVAFSPLLQRKRAATEAQFLLMAYVFDTLGYRRYEWKCDALNAPSRRAAERLGFRFEGVFRQAMVYKGRSRDTAWYAVIDREWPLLRAAFRAWLDPANFDAEGKQRHKLAALRAAFT